MSQGDRNDIELVPPVSYTDRYSAEDKHLVEKIIRWLNNQAASGDKKTQRMLGRAGGVNQSTVQAVLKGTYVSSPTKWLKELDAATQRLDARDATHQGSISFVETSVYRTVMAACKRAHLYHNFSVVSAYVGTGKTTALKEYANQHHKTAILVEATPDMNAAVMLNELVSLTQAVVHKAHRYSIGTKAERMAGVIRTLSGSDKLLIIDEAETVQASTLEYVRRISDKAGIGVVLAGTEKLSPMIRDTQGRFGQISSRVGFWPEVIKAIDPSDCRALVEAAFRADKVKLTTDIHDALWQCCGGSARVLMNNLIPGIRDYGLAKGHALTPELVMKLFNNLLGYKTKTIKPVVAR
jgi:DNA transposition AAA+ family ATPase